MSTRLATPRQTDYAQSLLQQVIRSQQTVDPDNAPDLCHLLNEVVGKRLVDPFLTTTEASEVIDGLKARLSYLKAKQSVAEAREDREQVGPGFYLLDGVVHRAVLNKTKTRTYAKRLQFSTGRWEYAGGAISKLSESNALTVEEAAALGHRYGICVCCGAELTDPQSIERGIGPVCLKNLNKQGRG